MKNKEFIDKIAKAIIESRREDALSTSLILSKKASLDPTDRFELASFFRRLGQGHLALKMLSHFLDEQGHPLPFFKNLEDRLCFEMGATFYGLRNKTLARFYLQMALKKKHHHEAHFFYALTFMLEWDYATAFQELERLLPLLPENYFRLVVQVNRLACLIELQFLKEADNLAKNLLIQAKTEGRRLLQGNLHELSGQIDFFQGASSSAHLTAALESFGNGPSRYIHFVEKWQALFKLREFKQTKDFFKVRKMASDETLRDMDFHYAIITKDQELLKFVFLNTPHTAYRKRQAFNSLPISHSGNEVLYAPNLESLSKLKTLAFSSSFFGQLEQKFLFYVLSDSYRSLAFAELFELLFPGEYFHFFHSVERLKQIQWRTNKKLSENHIPLQIKGLKKSFKGHPLTPHTLFHISFTFDQNPVLECLKKHHKGLSAKNLAHECGLSVRQLRRVLIPLEKQDLIKIVRLGTKKYYFKG